MNILEFMTALQKKALEYGLAVSLLLAAVWYQTDQLSQAKADLKQTAKEASEKAEKERKENDAKYEVMKDGLSSCNAERTVLKAEVESLKRFVYAKHR